MSRRLLIDVMNVVGSRPDRWWNDPDRAVRRMVQVLDDHAGATGEALTLVLDKDPGALPKLEHIDVVVARRKGATPPITRSSRSLRGPKIRLISR